MGKSDQHHVPAADMGIEPCAAPKRDPMGLRMIESSNVRLILVSVALLSLPWSNARADELAVLDGEWELISLPWDSIEFRKVGLGNNREAELPILGRSTIRLSNGELGSDIKVSNGDVECLYQVDTFAKSEMSWKKKAGPVGCPDAVNFRKAQAEGGSIGGSTSPPDLPAESAPPPPSLPYPTLVDRLSRGIWATGGYANCATPSKMYQLTSDASSVTWQDGIGNVDVERIIVSVIDSLQTQTISSSHPRGKPVTFGTRWSYSSIGATSVQIRSSAGSTFVLVRCP